MTAAAAGVLRPRARDSHKGTYGRVLVLGGSPGLSGAAGLAARGALAAGAGLVDVVVPPDLVTATGAGVPGAMVHAGETGREGGLSADVWDRWQSRLTDIDAVVAGPGLGASADTLQLLRRMLLIASRPMVLDADALNAFAGRAHWIEKRSGSVVLTPHPGELARLVGMSVEEVQADRLKAADTLAGLTGAVVVLKGEGTLVVQTGREPHLNLNGNPGLARGGSGDLLSGLLGGILAQGVEPFDAACLAVWLHGRAGDLAAWRHGPAGMQVTDVADALPQAWRDCGRMR
ncbi:MAG: NAD(P)H-hydrate dehydratase [Kiritimatiellia bacterium]